jgi:predicted TIM-barrel fold metal-dependent hydrolase
MTTMTTPKLTAIDCDGHFMERDTEIWPYLEGRYAGRKTGLWPGGQPWDNALGGRLGGRYSYAGDRSRRVKTAAEQVALWHALMDENDIEQAVLFPTGSGNIAQLQDLDFAIAASRACNNHFAHDYADARIKPVGVLPMRQPQAAAEELRRAAKELHLVGFEILTTGLPLALGDPYYDPVYRAAEECGVALCVHGTRHGAEQFGAGGLRTFAEVHAYAFPAGVIMQFTSILSQAVPIRFPRLRMAFLEIGASWLPYYLDRLDEHWEKRCEVDMPLLLQKPSDTFRASNIQISIEAGETLLGQTIEYAGAEHFMYATDVPHWDGEFPESLHDLRGRTDLSLEQKQQILSGNARQLYRL